MELTRTLFKEMVARGLAAVQDKKDELSALDGATGDGDHGIAICEAMSAALEAANPDVEFNKMLTEMGFAIMMKTSGSISTLLGALFLGMAKGATANELDAGQTATMLQSGLANVRQQTKADIGDKTMMDALIPAVAALDANQGEGLAGMFAIAAQAADEGRAKTADMVAKFGRARNLGERVIGHTDAGATSISYIFKAFAETLADLNN
ncbi:MAG: DAK2 domain-containing protein [Puniceicoccaceae bacterium]